MSGLRLPLAVGRSFASPMLRARQTAQALGLEDPILDARLMEQNWGAWEGLTREEIFRHGSDAFEKAGSNRARASLRRRGIHRRTACPGGGVPDGCSARRRDAVAVAHLGVLRAAYTLATGWDMSADAGRTGRLEDFVAVREC